MAWLEGFFEVVDSLVGLGSKAAHLGGVFRVRKAGQPPREFPVRMAGDC
jgi:hypothetical protein